MRKKSRSIPAAFAAAGMILVSILSGCAGPSTRILPREILAEQEDAEKMPVLEEANPFYLQESLELLAEAPRVLGSEEEQAAAEYMRQLLSGYGYDVTLQRFSVEEKRSIMGTNVVAVRSASFADADIVIVGSHYDTTAGVPGAGSCVAGAVTMLETARLLAKMPTDTELRFVCFSGQGDGSDGARCYVNSLTEGERARVVGQIQLGALGSGTDSGVDSGLMLGTEDGGSTLLGDRINEIAEHMFGQPYEYRLYEQGIHSIFVRGHMPAVYIGQKDEAYEYGSPFDRTELVETDQLAQVADLLSQTISGLMSTDSHSMIAKSRFQNDVRDGAYTQRREAALPFGQSREVLEKRTGQSGVLITENTDNSGRLILGYRYVMKWFDVDQLLMTDYYFTDGKLDLVTIDGDSAGVDFEDMKERLCSMYGEESRRMSGPNGTEYTWLDPLCRSSFTMVPRSDRYDLEIREYEPEQTLLQTDPRAERLMMLVQQVLPVSEELPDIDAVRIYTDGIGETENYLESETEDQGEEEQVQNPAYIWGVDLEDAVDEAGDLRNKAGTVRGLLRLYGQTLAQAEPERYLIPFETKFSGNGTADGADVSEPDGDGAGNGPSGSESGSALEDNSTGGDSFQGPSGAREDVAAEPGVHPGSIPVPVPDFAESFQWFVLTERPQDEAYGWGSRIRFFYEFEELVAYRERVRENLGLDPEGEDIHVSEADFGQEKAKCTF